MAVCCGERWAIHHPGCKDAPDYLDESIELVRDLKVGDKVYYSILDLERGICGPDDLVFGDGYETQEQIDANLHRLQPDGLGEGMSMDISHRHRAQLRIDKVKRGAVA